MKLEHNKMENLMNVESDERPFLITMPVERLPSYDEVMHETFQDHNDVRESIGSALTQIVSVLLTWIFASIVVVICLFYYGIIRNDVGVFILYMQAALTVVITFMFMVKRLYKDQSMFSYRVALLNVCIWLLLCGFLLGYGTYKALKGHHKVLNTE